MISSPYGHDGFLIEIGEVGTLVRAALARRLGSAARDRALGRRASRAGQAAAKCGCSG